MVTQVPVPSDVRHEPTDGAFTQSGSTVSYLPEAVHPYKFRAFGGEKICVCLAEFSDVRRYRDFCRIEAVVRVVFQIQPSLPPLELSIMTSVPTSRSATDGHLRLRLIRSAVNLGLLMHASEQEGLRKSA